MPDETKKPYQNVTVKKGKNSMAEIKGEITAETLMRHRENAIAEAKRDFSLPGFRKGNVPDEIFLKHIDEKHVLEDAAERALNEAYPLLLEDHGIEPVTPPKIAVTKLAFGDSLAFQATLGVMPDISLPDYKKLAMKIFGEKEPETPVTEREVNDVIAQIKQMRAAHAEEAPEPTELDDEFVRTLGDFRDVSDFREKLRANLALEKEHDARMVRRETFAKLLSEKTPFAVPEPLVEREIDALRSRLERQLEVEQMPKDDYFKKIGKTEEVFLKEQRDYIERQFKTKFILKKIAEKEGITPSEDEVREGVAHLELHHPDADPVVLYAHAADALTNEKTLAFLEDIGTKK